MNNNIENRKGARSIKEIPTEILDLLNKGELESVNLTEWLAVDQMLLVSNIIPQQYIKDCHDCINQLNNKTVTQVVKILGETLRFIIKKNNSPELFGYLSQHKSDIARCWASYIIGGDIGLNFEEKLNRIKPFAADHHFGVREIAWMAMRSDIETNLEITISRLSDWAEDEDENVRRFASESTRPNGVWCKHIETLKKNPEKALSILEKLRSDKSKYVQDSVGNWLNDASKSKPDFVKEICNKWEKESPTKETKYIIKKALRSLNKK